jgi:hypothetical protein
LIDIIDQNTKSLQRIRRRLPIHFTV